ncbi:MAG: DUF1015 domain-containing protein [Treponema sp.]|jgi:uncharacterized protein (DUF1015 family)|nr:DUF1015 domain-containing protein [Treponema sp.]
MSYKSIFAKYGISVPEILLPKKGTDLKAWAVIACDQFTQNRQYWKNAVDMAVDKPSMLHCILPEVYLEDNDREERLANINSTMQKYLDTGVFAEPSKCMIYLERKTAYGRTRKGLVTAVDLETYDWKPYSDAKIRATEQTIEERIPPRMEIRRNAPLESPHIMLLVSDSERLLVEKTGEKAKAMNAAVVYDTDLMLESGHITGYAIKDESLFEHIANSILRIAQKNNVDKTDETSSPLFAAGDGNHSLATAKAVWNEYKSKNPDVTEHPLRYALVEIVNIYDEGLTFEPIHRVLFGSLPEMLIRYVSAELSATVYHLESAEELDEEVKSSQEALGVIFKTETGEQRYTMIDAICPDLMVSYFQPILDTFLSIFGDAELDFIHGSDEIFRLGSQENTIGILLPQISKDNFFKTIASCGVLPRKSFSMGEASEKRFYMECRKLTK